MSFEFTLQSETMERNVPTATAKKAKQCKQYSNWTSWRSRTAFDCNRNGRGFNAFIAFKIVVGI